MKKIFFLPLSIIFFFSTGLMAYADDPLTGDNIQHFMNAMKPLKKLGEKHDIGNSDHTAAAAMSGHEFTPMTNSLKEIKAHKAYGEFQSIIKSAGFSSAEQWANIGDRIMRAYMSLKITAEMTPERKKIIQKSIQEIKKNEYLTPTVKEQLLKSMNQSLLIPNSSDKADTDMLKPYLTKLDQLFEEVE